MILVAGSVHMDILSKIESNEDVLDSPGSVSISIGGSAGNIAMNLAVAGEPVRLLSAMNNSAYSRIIQSHLTIIGIDQHIIVDPALPLSAFVAHINKNGEIRSAVSSMPVEKTVFDDQIIDDALNGVDAVVMECNLSSENLFMLAMAAHNRKIPVYVGAVSEAKAIRALSLMIPEAMLSSGIFCNEQEGARLLSFSGCPSMDRLSSIIGPLIVTMGAFGAAVYRAGKCEFANKQEPIANVESGNFLGAGDLFMSETVRHLVRGVDLIEAVSAGNLKSSEVITHVNCNLCEQDVIEQIINQTQSQSRYDNLTGLLNRAAMLSTYGGLISALKRNNRPCALLLLDLDRFKSINDTLGHDAGDKVLKGFSDILKIVFRESDIIGRWGGEEFLVLMPETDLCQAREAGERLRHYLATDSLALPCKVTVSGGIVEANYLTETLFDSVKKADLLLYEAKNNGRDRLLT